MSEQEQPAPQPQQQLPQITITATPDGTINVSSNISSLPMELGLLEMGKSAVLDYHARKAKPPASPIILPPHTMPPR